MRYRIKSSIPISAQAPLQAAWADV